MTEETEQQRLRPIAEGDVSAVAAMLERTGLFPPGELAEVLAMLTGALDGSLAGDHRWALAEIGGKVAGAAYWAPERMTEGTWNLFMLAVDPKRQGIGLGQRLVAHVEERCREEGVRMLLVETLGIAEFAAQRAFYARCGYEEEARVRDFYGEGLTKVIFRKLL